MSKKNTQKKKVLLVDDDPLIIRMYEHKLSDEGYDVILAFDGEEGIVKAADEQPDIILLDLMMPKMNGIDALKHLKKDPKTKKIPVVILTNIGDDQAYVKTTKELGAEDYMVKATTSLKDLAARVASIV